MKHPVAYHIAASDCFVEGLAELMLLRHGREGLSHCCVLLPNHRSLRSLQEAFLRRFEGEAALLPSLVAIGDIDDAFLLRHAKLDDEQLAYLHSLPPAEAEESRLFELAELIWAFQKRRRITGAGKAQSLAMAEKLASFLDEMHQLGCDWRSFDELIPEDYASQWQDVAQFLQILRELWPQRLKELGRVDAAWRGNAVLSILIKAWEKNGSSRPVYAAGLSSRFIQVARLAGCVARMEDGLLLLHGVDVALLQSETLIDPTHPQAELQAMLRRAKIPATAVHPLQGLKNNFACPRQGNAAREAMLNRALEPADLTPNWQEPGLDIETALNGMALVEAGHVQEEAGVVALLLREVLEMPGKSAALVTSNRDLARRVGMALQRWAIHVDDSAGRPLSHAAPGVFLQLLAEAVVTDFEPVALLALCKHPYFRLGRAAGQIRPLVRQLELQGLRQALSPDWEAVLHLLKQQGREDLMELAEKMSQVCAPLRLLFQSSEEEFFSELLATHLAVAETLSLDEEGRCLLWQGVEGETLTRCLQPIQAHCGTARYDPRSFLPTLGFLLARASLRPLYGTHPRLQILGPIEARLQHFDRVILADVNEGGWPAKGSVDPWLSRPMRRNLQLTEPEHQIGREAHDFITNASQPEVFFTRSLKQGGTPTVPSRYLLRLEALLRLQGGEAAVQRLHNPHPLANYLRMVEVQPVAAVEAPMPCPPVTARPRQLSVTAIEKLLRDPYSIYAERILRLKPLEGLEKGAEARELGNALHQALELFINAGEDQTADPYRNLLAQGKQAMAPYVYAPVVEALWWPRFCSVARFVVANLPQVQHSLQECRGEWRFAAPAGMFTVTAKVDRMYVDANGLHLMDYKTGSAPALRDVKLGLSNQLVLAALIAREGGFGTNIAAQKLAGLDYWRLSGGRKGGEVQSVSRKDVDIVQLVEQAAGALPRLIARFDRVETAYRSLPVWRDKPRYNDYEHLARVGEWQG